MDLESKRTQRLVAAIDDVFFMAKIRDAATAAGLDTEFAVSRQDALRRAKLEGCRIVVVDLNAGKMEPVELVRDLKAEGKEVLGFLSHVHTELRAQAIEAGADRVLARSALSQSILQILRTLPV
jgi:DNA-binding NarL/FixJ family response regulator